MPGPPLRRLLPGSLFEDGVLFRLIEGVDLTVVHLAQKGNGDFLCALDSWCFFMVIHMVIHMVINEDRAEKNWDMK